MVVGNRSFEQDTVAVIVCIPFAVNICATTSLKQLKQVPEWCPAGLFLAWRNIPNVVFASDCHQRRACNSGRELLLCIQLTDS
jgi:hypothetical protein